MKPAYMRITAEGTGDVIVERIARATLLDSQLYDHNGHRLPDEEQRLTEEEIGRIYLLEPGESITLDMDSPEDPRYVITCLDYTLEDIPNTNEIQSFVHCGLCLAENPPGQTGTSMEEYARLSVGITPIGWQVWCVRHNVNVVHVDYAGNLLYANNTRQANP